VQAFVTARRLAAPTGNSLVIQRQIQGFVVPAADATRA